MSNPTREFVALLADVYGNYGKPIPDGAVVGAWWRALAPFPHRTVAQAFSSYAMERPDFAPVPNSISARCRLLDGRPTDDEAWALALSSRDERETVVWCDEMAQAFATCQPVLTSGDEVGARMAFKDAYNRMVGAARAANRQPSWSVSPGWDAGRRQLVVEQAARNGLLPAPQALALLPNGLADGDVADCRPEGLQRVLAALAELESPIVKAERMSQARMDAETRHTEEIARKVAAYKAEKRGVIE